MGSFDALQVASPDPGRETTLGATGLVSFPRGDSLVSEDGPGHPTSAAIAAHPGGCTVIRTCGGANATNGVQLFHDAGTVTTAAWVVAGAIGAASAVQLAACQGENVTDDFERMNSTEDPVGPTVPFAAAGTIARADSMAAAPSGDVVPSFTHSAATESGASKE